MHNHKQKKGIIGWIDYRLPIFTGLKHFAKHKTPRNLTHAWSFGSISGLMLTIQILTGIFLAMHYTPHIDYAFDSVEHIMRDVNYGWLMRYVHANGASFFFIAVYIHILRGLYYGSYKSPREILWFVGVLIFILMMATAFMGYVLPWGQMSYWGATVITNLFTSIPFVGEDILNVLLGGFNVGNATLNRFFVLHYLIPLIIVGVVVLHLFTLFRFGSNNPTGVEAKTKKDVVDFHPYYTAKDFEAFGFFMLAFFMFAMFYPNSLGHPDNYIEANPLVTPEHIVPEWYFLPFYAILRAIPDKFIGVLALFSAVLILFFLPLLDRHKVRSGTYRPIFKIFFVIFALNFLWLMWVGGQAAEEPYITMSRIGSIYYFSYFLLILPLLSKYENCGELPESIWDSMKANNKDGSKKNA